jgi:hypothetical protein
MSCSQVRTLLSILLLVSSSSGQVAKQAQSSEASSSKHTKTSSARLARDVDPGTVANGVYRNRVLGLSCKIPAGWVLRTAEMNAREGTESSGAIDRENPHLSQNQGEVGHPNSDAPQGNTGESGRVLLAAFSRPPAARGEDVNSSIVIAVERQVIYPGLQEAAQYFGPLTEVAKAQGFDVDEEPYEEQIGSKVVVRGDFHKDVGSRVMRQSTLAFLAQGYAVSITVIGGTDDEVEELVDGVQFGAGK